MRRKLVLHGPSSLSISLPFLWIKRNRLNKGDEVDLVEAGNTLVLMPVEHKEECKKAEASFIGINEDTQEDYLLALHKKGFNEIKLFYEDPKTLKDILRKINDIQLGYEIMRQESNHLILRRVSKPEEDQFNDLLRRLFRITIEYANRVYSIMKDKQSITESHLLHEVSARRISNLCKRILVREHGQDSPFLLSIIEGLEAVAKNLSLLLLEVRKRDKAVPEEIIAISTSTSELLRRTYELNYNFSLSEYNNIKSFSRQVGTCLQDLMHTSDFYGIDNISRLHSKIEEILPQILAIQLSA